MNPYTSAWTGVTPGDGPQRFHLVLLDNGRTATLGDEVGRDALHCIKCSACMNVCPVYERTGGHAYGSVYPGPIGAVLTPQLTGIKDNPTLPYASTLCGACFDVCPVRIDIPSLLVRLRSQKVEEARAHSPRAVGGGGRDGRRVVDDVDARRGSPRRRRRRGSGGCSGGRRAGSARCRRPLSGWTASRDAARGRPRRRSASGGRPREGRQVSTAREDVLSRIKAANAAAGHPIPSPIPRDYHRSGTLAAGSRELLELLVDRLVDYKATVVESAPDGIPSAIAQALTDAGVTGRVLVPPGLPEGWCPDGVADEPGFTPLDLDGFAAVVTASAASCAQTGTIALDGSPDQGRRAITLVPDVHVCVVRADQVVETVPELVARLEPTRPTTFISGPSATSDIELERVEGVHGPRTLIVVLAA